MDEFYCLKCESFRGLILVISFGLEIIFVYEEYINSNFISLSLVRCQILSIK